MSDETKDPYATLYCDRSKWEPGPWDRELDRYQWKAHGFDVLMVRQARSGHWCGYVGVPPGHPWHGIEGTEARRADGEYIEVHGGITYSADCAGRVCHLPEPGQPEHLYWLGFDCKHAWDEAPGDAELNRRFGWPREPDKFYKDEAFVRAECESLARQAAEVRP